MVVLVLWESGTTTTITLHHKKSVKPCLGCTVGEERPNLVSTHAIFLLDTREYPETGNYDPFRAAQALPTYVRS